MRAAARSFGPHRPDRRPGPTTAARRGGLSAAASAALWVLLALTTVVVPGVGTAAVPHATSPADLSGRHGGTAGPLPNFVVTRVYYNSSIDGFNLSYSEVLPTNYAANRSYPLAVELHGLLTGESTPIPGGYSTNVTNSTATAAAASGFILILPNTRTGDGWYLDSPYTGPQAQDVLDAITHERALRSVGPVYVFGVSMGATGALALALHHPSLFTGAGAIAGFSDPFMLLEWAQSALHDAALVSAILAPTNGSWPNATPVALSLFDWLSALRLDPADASDLHLYFASGAADSVATNNAGWWSYQQANSTLLDETCWSVLALAEPGNCTRPLAALAAATPGAYAFRYVFEPNGPHEYTLLNATDMFRYFLGKVPSGTYWGSWPTPSPVAPPTPLVTVVTQPWSCGTVGVDGIPLPSGSTVRADRAVHPIAFTACPGFQLTGVRTVGAVTFAAASSELNVTGSGAVVATFSVPQYFVNVSTALGCPSIYWNGSVVPNGTGLVVPAGWYIASASPCGFATFSGWNVSGGVTVEHASSLDTEVSVHGNGTIHAVYRVPTSSNAPKAAIDLLVSPPGCGPVVLNGTAYPNGTVVDLNLGSYGLVAASCPGYAFQGWVATPPGARVGEAAVASTTLVVAGDGSVTAVYTPPPPPNPVYTVTVGVAPPVCGPVVEVGAAWYPNGSALNLPAGDYALAAGSCAGYQFGSWSTGSSVWLAPAGSGARTLVVGGNGTVSATYTQLPVTVVTPPAATNPTVTAPPPSWAWVGIGISLGAAAMGGVVIWIWARRSRAL
ncbi:MAG TPA: alpha/beta hydrolase-fold protein [Thermoplasmata archaeon]|nr:alpha/beta hydrolase-fold protein [Thermoplasmata archaeon]